MLVHSDKKKDYCGIKGQSIHLACWSGTYMITVAQQSIARNVTRSCCRMYCQYLYRCREDYRRHLQRCFFVPGVLVPFVAISCAQHHLSYGNDQMILWFPYDSIEEPIDTSYEPACLFPESAWPPTRSCFLTFPTSDIVCAGRISASCRVFTSPFDIDIATCHVPVRASSVRFRLSLRLLRSLAMAMGRLARFQGERCANSPTRYYANNCIGTGPTSTERLQYTVKIQTVPTTLSLT